MSAASRLSIAMFALTVGSAATGCAETLPPPPPPVVTFAERDENMARLFDDTFDPSVLGLSFDGASPAKDVTLPERVRLSEFVGRVAVETISRDANGQRVRYLITLRLEPNRLVDRASFPPTVELKITEESPAFSVVSARESSFRGLTFILYARRLAAAEGPELYWHATVDDPEVAKAILVARDLSPLVD